jgi:hypothetical protein
MGNISMSKELSHFVECICDCPSVSGEDGLSARRLAERVRHAVGGD